MINLIIYSFNRAMQLDALIRSLKLNFEQYDLATKTIIYKHSSEDFKKGYDILKEENKDILWLCENDVKYTFKQLTENALMEENPFTMFAVDDDIVINKFSLLDKEVEEFNSQEDAICLSLRLSKNTNFCYPLDSYMSIPEFNGNTFNWTTAEKDWNYPLSLDMNLFTTFFIKSLAIQLPYSNPNTFESYLSQCSQHLTSMPKMVCYKEASRIVGVPANMVQQTFLQNRVANTNTPEELNEKFLAGKRIDINKFQGMITNSPHMELSYGFMDG